MIDPVSQRYGRLATAFAERIDPAEVPRLRREAEAFGEAMRGPGGPLGPR